MTTPTKQKKKKVAATAVATPPMRHDEDAIMASAEAIILFDTPHLRTLQLPSGTIRRDRLEETLEEIEEGKKEKAFRRQQRCTAIGSAD